MKTHLTPWFRNSSFGFLLLLACIIVPAGAQTSHIVDVTNNVFTPAQLTISPGDTVVWTNSEGNHNVNGAQTSYPSNPESFGNDVGVGWTFSHVFTLAGTYDYQCDPHVGWGMLGQVLVEASGSEEGMLTINFTGMTPHVGQTLWLLVEDRDESEELIRMTRIIEESFTLGIPGITAGNDYRVEFFADHNGNGAYDDPPADHAWRYDLDAVSENEVLDFAHNTDFQDIDWDHRVVVNLSGMSPHVGQEIYFALIDAVSGQVIDRESEIVSESFTVELSKNMSATAYHVDFFSDHNDNGYYDAPPTDHAWRLEFNSSMGDDSLDFVHNTNFTDIFLGTGFGQRGAEQEGVSVYPNPAVEYIHIESDVEIEALVLYDARGSSLISKSGLKSSLVTLPLEEIRSGIYFLELRTVDRQYKITRLVKQ